MDSLSTLPNSMVSAFNVPPDHFMNKGSLASVFKVHDKVTGEPFAIKVHSRAALAAKGQERRISKEFDTLKRCTKEGRGRHVVHLVSAAEEHGRVLLQH